MYLIKWVRAQLELGYCQPMELLRLADQPSSVKSGLQLVGLVPADAGCVKLHTMMSEA
jgi:hypothetical protein